MGKKSAPPAPDYAAAAEKTAQSDLQMAQYATNANRINQVTPYGSLSYTNNKTLDNAAYQRAMQEWQATGAKKDKMPSQNSFYTDNWTQTESFDPRIQNALDSQIAVQQGLSDQANSMIDTVKNQYSQPFNAKSWNDYKSGVGAVDTSKIGTAGTFNGDGSGIDTSRIAGAGLFGGNGSGVNLNVPQFTNARQDEYARAAYDSQMGLLRGDLDTQEQRVNNNLALKGLTAGSEASNNSLGSFYDGRSRQLNALAAQSVLTGNQMSNADYSSQLAGFGAGNDAQAQKFGMDQAGYETNLKGIATNAALQEAYNAAQQQKFAMDESGYKTNLQGLTTNAALQEAYNAAQQQQFSQAQSDYGTNWQEQLALRQMPLNELNALLSGQQVQDPTFEQYAMQGQTGGANYLGAAQAQGTYDTNVYNQKMSNLSALYGTAGKIGGAMFGGGGLFGAK